MREETCQQWPVDSELRPTLLRIVEEKYTDGYTSWDLGDPLVPARGSFS